MKYETLSHSNDTRGLRGYTMRRRTVINLMTGEPFVPYSCEDTIILYGLDDWQTDKMRDIAQNTAFRES